MVFDDQNPLDASDHIKNFDQDVTVLLVTFGALYDIYEERIEELAKNTSEIVLFCAFSGEPNELADVPSNVTLVPLTHNRDIRLFPFYPLLFFLNFLYWVIVKGKEFDVIHSIDYFVGPFCAIIGAFISDTTSVVSIRGLPKEITPEYRSRLKQEGQFLSYLFSTSLLVYYRFVCYASDNMIFKSDSERTFLKKMCRSDIDDKSHIIPTGVDTESFQPNDSTVSESLAIKELFGKEAQKKLKNKEIVLYAGRLTDGKGVLSLANYHASWDRENVCLLIIGSPSHTQFGGFMDELTEITNKCENIYLYPERVAHELISDIINVSSVVVLLPSYGNEGAPKILQESLVMNTPSISTKVNGVKEAFSDIPGCILIEPNNKQEYYLALDSILTDGANVDTELAISRFDLATNFRRVADVYKEQLE